ncbi:MAG: M23 family metallopeptidase [Prolixibacteraceae bacterium]|nr:M23 family metallopeptidase [Prolixibacteraceae bacterium]
MKLIFVFIFSFVMLTLSGQTFNSVVKHPKAKEVKKKNVKGPIAKYQHSDSLSIQKTDNDKDSLSIERRILFSSPLNHLKLNSAFGLRKHPILGKMKNHNGIDLKARADTVKSILPGVVKDCGYDAGGLGYFIRISHSHGGYETIYGHLSKFLIDKNLFVNPGQAIGITGSSGLSTGEHLHFEVLQNGKPINPINFLSRISICAKNLE